jgi:two-component system, NarL family, nitrate/nitrite response regulator NarL
MLPHAHAPSSQQVRSVNSPFRAVVVSDVRLFVEGLAQRLSSDPTLTVVGTAGDAATACECVRRLQPEVVLIDASSPEFLRIVPVLRDAGASQIVAFAVGEREADAIMCAEAGVSALVERSASLNDLLNAVRAGSRGELALSPRLTAMLFRRVGLLSRDGVVQTAPDLTSRESEILALLQVGLSNKQIAARLGIRLPTVKNHVHRLLEKLGVHRRAEAVALARRRS